MSQQTTFRALILEQRDDAVRASIRDLPADSLPEGDVLVRVAFSSLNFKDGLAVTGKGRVVRGYPMVPGIDLAGTVVESASPDFRPGDRVVATGWGLGENHWGGYTELERLRAGWLVPLPEGLSLQEAMGIGTAGFTAMLSVMALEKLGLEPGGEVVVTGAGGGLGSLAVAILAHLGYRVAASTGRAELHEYLRSLGAAEILDRDALAAPSGKPLERARWAGAIDAVGGATLAGLLRGMAERSSIAVCGNAGGAEFTTTVFPFILRGVSLLGIESARVPVEERRRAWARLAEQLPRKALRDTMTTRPLEEVPALAQEIIGGKVRGRVVIDIGS